MNKTVMCLFVFLATLPGCKKRPFFRHKLYMATPCVQKTEAIQEPSPATPYITVWVHGSRAGIVTKHILKNMFHAPDGLLLANDFACKYHLRKIAESLAQADPINYPQEHIYLFGWSGDLSFEVRRATAERLYEQISVLVADYTQKFGKRPRLRIITHSHGGNVALNLAAVAPQTTKLHIDELILLACPVQAATACYIASPLFGEVFAFYSTFDFFQVADPQGIYKHNGSRPLFSRRKFAPCEKLSQVRVMMDGRALMHIDFVLLPFISRLPGIMRHVRCWNNRLGKRRIADCTQLLSLYTTPPRGFLTKDQDEQYEQRLSAS